MRLAAYSGASVALATGVFMKALHQRANVYSACVYLSQSSANLMILTNLCLLIAGFVLFWLQRLLYGPLRPIETEQLYEKAWFAVTETCLAMTIFRGELGGWFLVMFVSLLVGKVWGWIGEGRVEFLEQQPPTNPRLFHTRLAASLLLSVLFNAYLLNYCVMTVLDQARPDMMVMFGFEFAVLTILSTSTAARYTISLVEIYITHQQTKAKIEESRAEIRAAREEAISQHQQSGGSGAPANLPDENDINEMELDVPGWEEKGRWVFYLDLVTDFLKLTVYLTFFAILFTFYGLPIHILRDVVVTIRSFGRRIIDFLRYRNATRDMNERYPDATVEEVTREEVCIICREEMTSWQQPPNADGPGARPRPRIPERLRPKKLPCGHILHFACLRSWLERQQNCPTCRRPVVVAPRNAGFAGDGGPRGRGNGAPGLQPNLGEGNQAAGPQGGGVPGARIYQFGPFRVGFGAGRGEFLNDFHQQIRQGNAQQQENEALNPPPDARQIGFGIGFGRPQPTPTAAPGTQPTANPTSNVADIQGQLQQMEQQITQEISNLRVTAEHLHLVRLLQAELQRLRSLQAHPPGLQGPPAQTGAFLPPSMSSVTVRRQFMSDPRSPTLGSGDARLPDGLTLPQGWTLTPLQSAQQGSNQDTTPNSASNGRERPTQQTPDNAQVPGASPTAGSGENENKANDQAATENPSNAPTQPAEPMHRSESPSQDWTHVTPERPPDEASGASGPAIDTEKDTNRHLSEEEQSSSSPKGKSRVATVEDAADDGA